jgi:hypothetical protein
LEVWFFWNGINLFLLDIPTWLNSLGLAKFVDVFQQNEISIDVLPYLTETHLEKMGVPTIGARLKILSSIAKQKGTC